MPQTARVAGLQSHIVKAAEPRQAQRVVQHTRGRVGEMVDELLSSTLEWGVEKVVGHLMWVRAILLGSFVFLGHSLVDAHTRYNCYDTHHTRQHFQNNLDD
jgi:hypothetical protein